MHTRLVRYAYCVCHVQIGAIMLVGLFFYDIFWVFGTDVMVTVAKSFDGPIKVNFSIKLACVCVL
jgi:Signal peptide peptidase